MTPNLSQLLRQIKQCRLCLPDLPLGVNPVVRASESAKLVVAGQAPGIAVHKTSIPFNDPSGVRLRKWMGVDELTFYDESRIAIVPMGFCYPGKGKSGDLPPRSECAATWHSKLLSLMPHAKLTLAIGQYAQSYYLAGRQAENLTQTVKQWQDYLPHVIPLPHPSPRNNVWLRRNPWFEAEVVPQMRQRVQALLSS